MIFGGLADSLMTHGSAPACVYTDTDTGTQTHTYSCPHSWAPHTNTHIHVPTLLGTPTQTSVCSSMAKTSPLIFSSTRLYSNTFDMALLFAMMQCATSLKKIVSAHLFYRHIVVSIVALVFAIMHYI